MTVEELKGLLANMKTKMADMEAKGVDTKAIMTSIKDIETKSLEGVKGVETKVETLDVAIKALKEENVRLNDEIKLKLTENSPKALKSVPEAVAEQIATKSKLTGGQPFKLELATKDLGVIDGASILTGDIPAPDRDKGLSYLKDEPNNILDNLSKSTTTSDFVEWEEEVGLDKDDVIFAAELDTAGEVSMTYRTAKKEIKKLFARTSVTREKLEDVAWMASEIKNVLVRRLRNKKSTAILFGDSTTDVNSIDGLVKYAQSFTAAKIPEIVGAIGTSAQATAYDAIVACIAQVRAEFHEPSAVYVTPGTRALLKLLKNVDGDYIVPTFQGGLGTMIDGIPVHVHHKIEADKILVCDLKKATDVTRRKMVIEVGMFGNDLITDKRTVIISERFLLKVKANDTKAFVYDSIPTILGIIAP